MMWNQLDLFSAPETQPRTVSDVTAHIRALLEREPTFRDLSVIGEVSNYSRASSGHVYFTLKDAGAQLSCVIWRSRARDLRFTPRPGDEVVAHGYIGLYEQSGRYQLYVDDLRPAGRGSLYQEFERLKARLEAEGLFDPQRKRPLPSFPHCIGVVTSPTAAALRDVLQVLGRRYPLAKVILAPTLVQGEAAPPQIVAALAALNKREDVEVILVVRGGGSLEDLWAFNDEQVARAIAASRLPVVSGVGHETDFTLADFAADVRAPTPSAAAEIVSPDRVDLRAALSQLRGRLAQAMTAKISTAQAQTQQLHRALSLLSPERQLAGRRQQVDDLLSRADRAIAHRLASARQKCAGLSARLDALNPDAVLSRGYAIVYETASGQLLSSARQTAKGTLVRIRWYDGQRTAEILE